MTRDVRTEDRTSHLFSKGIVDPFRKPRFGGYLRVFSPFVYRGRVLSHSRPARAGSQDPLHLVPRDMSVGPEQSSDPRLFEPTRMNKALPSQQTTRVR